MYLEMNESALADAVRTLSPNEQQQFFATMKAVLGLPLNLRETVSVTGMAERFQESGDPAMAALLQTRADNAMTLRF